MARMIPSTISPAVKSNAERRIFEWFRDDPLTVDWVVLHSLGITNHNRVIHGEIDFVVLAPNLGLFALEVKGGRVKQESGVWHFTDKHGASGRKVRGPFDQAWDGVFSIVASLVDKLDASHRYMAEMLYGIGVMFPDITYTAISVDEEQWQVFDCNDGRKVGAFVQRVAAGTRRKWEERYGPLRSSKLPSTRDVEYIASLLRGDFDKAVAVSVQLRNAEEELVELTKEQYRCLDQIDDNPRCVIQGAAGTGKTLLAIEETKKAAAAGEKVALFCFNANLGEWLRSHFSKMSYSLRPAYVGTFHRYMAQMTLRGSANLRQPCDEDIQRFYTEDLPEAASVALQHGSDKYDKIIIDEAQDLIKPQYLDVMDLSLKKGFYRGKWTMYGDFSMQAIYSGDRNGDELKEILEHRTAFIWFKLTMNCRNTKPICEEIETVTGFHPPSSVWVKTDGPPVNYLTYSSQAEQRTKLQELLTSLMSNGIDKRKITILSPVRRENSVVSQIDDFDIRDFQVSSLDDITFSTIQAYKGLENTVIILTDIDSFQSDKLMYVALSRARVGLNVLTSDSAHSEYLELQRRRFMP